MKIDKEKYVFSLEIKVRDYELDCEGIVNNANYIHYLELTRHEFCEMVGVSFKQMLKDGLIPVANRIEIDYRRSERSGDTLVSCLWVERKGVRFLFHQDLYDKATGELAVNALVSIVMLQNGVLTRGDELAEAFSPYLQP
ncbi:MAG: acyl-CoA thioesterase [Muribaculaceae bacterium]|nr:acyl-CoA thioesterase [Muribaculaceae bacterium]